MRYRGISPAPIEAGLRPPWPHRRARLLLLLFSLTAALTHAADVAPRMLLLAGVRAPGDRVIVVGERGTILQSANRGQTWQPAASGTHATLTGVTFAPDSAQGWAVGHDALILTTSDGGATWTQQYQGESTQDSFLDVLALDARRVLAIGAYGLFFSTTDGGKTWTRRKVIDDDAHLNRLTRGPSGTLYLAGEHGTLLRSADQGVTWTRIPAPYDGSFYGVLPLDDHTLLAHGLRGRVFRSPDDGASWSPVATPQAVLLAAAVHLKSNLLLLAGHPRVILVSRDSGQTFSPVALPLTTAVTALLELTDGQLLALGEAGATLLPAPP